jgi:AraC family transcriptional regulator of adaptative response/methylated-DNA-[protein]-cysteine methyltransferase
MHFTEQHYFLVARAIDYVVQFQERQPDLTEIAGHIGLSECHFQRVFTAWAGISPKKFLQFLTKEKAKERLRDCPLMTVALDLGLSGTSRLHDLMITWEGVTPGEYQSWGEGLQICYGLHDSPFGYCLLAQTPRGLCKCAFYDQPEQAEVLISELYAEWPRATITRDEAITAEVCSLIFPAQLSGTSAAPLQRLHLLLKGSKFQLKVWEGLLHIPDATLVSYQQLAYAIGEPQATRAVASAVARNHLAYLVPCHRVIRSNGEFSQYRWGALRKLAMIGREGGMMS